MAKFAKVTYGTKGDTAEYTYVVNDNVRTGDWIQPSVKHYISGKIFGTTGIIQSTQKQLDNATKTAIGDKDIATAYTQKELGINPERTEKGTFGTQGALGKAIKNEATGMYQAQPGKEFVATSNITKARLGNVAMREAQKGGEADTFDTYSKQFMNQGDQ